MRARAASGSAVQPDAARVAVVGDDREGAVGGLDGLEDGGRHGVFLRGLCRTPLIGRELWDPSVC